MPCGSASSSARSSAAAAGSGVAAGVVRERLEQPQLDGRRAVGVGGAVEPRRERRVGAGRIARQQPQAGERRGLLGRGGLTGAVAQLRLGRRGAAERGAADRLQPGGKPAHRRHHRPALAQLGRALERLERRLRPALGDREPGALHHHRHPQRDVGRVGQQLVRAAEVGERVLAPVALQRDAAERRLGEPDRPRPHPAALARERERLAGQPARPLQPAGHDRVGGEAGDGDEREPVAAAGLGRAAGGLEVAGGGLQRARSRAA